MKKHEKINIRQLCIFYFIYSLSIKVLALPSLLSSGAGNLAWFSALIGVILEIATVFIATFLLKKIEDSPKLGKILCGIFLPIVVYSIWTTVSQIYKLAYKDLFTNLNIFIFVLTLVFIGFFFLSRKPRAFFRAGEILWVFFALALIVAIVPTLYGLKADWQLLITGNYNTVLTTAFGNLIYFESAVFLFVFGSETKKKTEDIKKIKMTSIFCGIGFVLFMALFVLLFAPLGVYKDTAIIDFTTASLYVTNSGALDWMIASSALMMLILRFGAGLVAIVYSIKRMTNKND